MLRDQVRRRRAQRVHGQGQQVKVEDGDKTHDAGQSDPSPHELSQPGSGTPRGQAGSIESGAAQNSGDLDIEAMATNFFEDAFFEAVDTRHPAVQLGPGDIVDEVHFSWVAEQTWNERNGVQVRSNLSSVQVFGPFTLTLLTDRTQTQSFFSCLHPPPHSLKKRSSDSSMLLVCNQPRMTEAGEPNFDCYWAPHQTAED